MAVVESIGDITDDIQEGFRLTPLWWRLGIESTVSRYRRTLLGPFWLASSMLATGLGLSIVFGTIFGGDWRQNFSFILSGVLCFGLVSSLIAEGTQVFLAASGTMQTRGFPLSFHVFLMCDKILINFAHQVVAFWFVTAIFKLIPVPHWHLLFTLPLVVAIGFFISFPLGMIAARFRDVNYFIGFIMQAMFMLTPVFWRASQVSGKMHFIVDFNPLAHMLEVLRQPFLGHPAPPRDLVDTLMILFVSAILAAFSLAMYRRRVIFWL